MSQNATLTQGTKLYRKNPSTSVYEAIPELTNINGPDATKSEIRQTDLDSTAEEYSGGLPDFGRSTCEMYYRGGLAIHRALWNDFIDPLSPKRDYRVVFTDGVKLDFTAIVFAFPRVVAPNDSVKGTLTLRHTGVVVES